MSTACPTINGPHFSSFRASFGLGKTNLVDMLAMGNFCAGAGQRDLGVGLLLVRPRGPGGLWGVLAFGFSLVRQIVTLFNLF